MKRLPMRKIRDALRLRADGLSMREIAASLGVGQSTLSDYLKRAARAGLVWPLPEALTDAALEAMLFQPVGGATRRVHAPPDWPGVHRELGRKHMTLSLLWEEYRASYPDGYGHRLTNQVRHRLCPGSPWERDTATSRLRRDAAYAA